MWFSESSFVTPLGNGWRPAVTEGQPLPTSREWSRCKGKLKYSMGHGLSMILPCNRRTQLVILGEGTLSQPRWSKIGKLEREMPILQVSV